MRSIIVTQIYSAVNCDLAPSNVAGLRLRIVVTAPCYVESICSSRNWNLIFNAFQRISADQTDHQSCFEFGPSNSHK